MPEPEELQPDVTQQEHDLILPYVIVGIFAILVTAVLAITRVISLPITSLVLLAVPIAGWSDRFPEMMSALQTKLRGVFAFLDEARKAIGSLMGKNGLELSVSQGNPVVDIAMSSSTAAGGLLIFVATVCFWLWLWGPIGAVLSTPILLVAMVAQEEFARYRKAQSQPDATAEPHVTPVAA